MPNIKAEWSGSYPCLCYGKWTLKLDGINVSDKIPKSLINSSMNTYGKYEHWSFDGNMNEYFESYCDGLNCEEWIKSNKNWLNLITDDMDIQKEIFSAIQAEDFRPGSCGGCI